MFDFKNMAELFMRPVWEACLIGAFLGLLLAPDCTTAQDIHPDSQRYYQQALHAQSLSEKIKLFERAVEIEPYFVDALFQLGVTYYQKGQYTQAINYLLQAKDLAPELAQETSLYLRNAHTFRASEQISREEYEEAITTVQQAIAVDEEYAQAFTVLGRAYFGVGDWQAAIAALEKSTALDEDSEIAWNRLGDCYLRTKQYHKSVAAYEKALILDPELKEARVHLRIAQRRNRPDAWLMRFEVLRKSGHLAEAIEILKTAQDIYPDHSRIATALKEAEWESDYQAGTTAMEEGRWQQALERLQGIDPEYEDTALKLVEVRTALGIPMDSVLVETTLQESEEDSFVEVSAQSELPEGDNGARSKSEARVREEVTEIGGVAAVQSEQKMIAADEEPVGSPEAAPLADTTAVASSDYLVSKSVDRYRPIFPDDQIDVGGAPKYYWLLGALGSVLIVSLVLIKRTFSHKLRPKETTATSEQTGELQGSEGVECVFKDEVASITPVQFEDLEASEVLEEENETDDSQLEDERLALKETQTILGGIKKVKRIGRYVLEKEIGRGSMGLIYKAWDPKLDRVVVIKQVAFGPSNKPHEMAKLKDRLFREARAAGRLNHENIVIIYDVDEERDFSYIVMEYLDGQDLKSLLESGEQFDLKRTLHIIRQICSALSFAHQNGIVHRDIKPSNIILLKYDRVKVADFGIAKFANLGTLTQTGSIVGTPFYMSPEQIEGRKLDGRSDIFSAGVILYEMATGTHPFAGDNISTVVYKIVHKVAKLPSTLNRALPRYVDAMVERACAKDVANRYADADEFLQDLEKVKDELG